MRSIGVICVALGILLLMFSSFPILLAENSTQLLFGLGCMGFVALPLLLTGILLTRRAAKQSGSEGEAAASSASLQRAGPVLQFLGGDPPEKADPEGTPMERLRAFDLNTLTVAGWLLVLASGGFVFGEVVLFRWLFPRAAEEMGPAAGFLFFGEVLLGFVFFALGRAVLKALGLPVSEKPKDPSEGENPSE
jgi:hypothetical protein